VYEINHAHVLEVTLDTPYSYGYSDDGADAEVRMCDITHMWNMTHSQV